MAKRNTKNGRQVEYDEKDFGSPVTKLTNGKFRLKCKNEAQKELSKLITNKEVVVAAGPAGCGKSYVAIARGIELLQNVSNPYKRLIISKPAVESEEKVGFIPGTLKDKLEPHLESAIEIVDKIMGAQNRRNLEDHNYLIVQPLGFIRGKTFDNSIIIIEEAQNLSPKQCKTILTRIGHNSKLIISGDLDQSDRYNDVRQSGLYELFRLHQNVEEVGFHTFKTTDIVRNPLITKLLNNYPQTEIPDLSKETGKKEVKTDQKSPILIKNKLKSTKKEVKSPKKVVSGEKTNNGIMSQVGKFFKENFTW